MVKKGGFKMYPLKIRERAIRLRRKNRLSLSEISKKLGVSLRLAYSWVNKYPLSNKEIREKISKSSRLRHRPKKDRGIESKFYPLIKDKNISTLQKAKIAEAAVSFRLALLGFGVYSSVFDGEKFDFLVHIPNIDILIKLQVKWCRAEKHGLPVVLSRCADGRGKTRKYTDGEFDFIAGYNIYTDTVYVFSFKEMKGKTGLSITKSAEEAWHKMLVVPRAKWSSRRSVTAE